MAHAQTDLPNATFFQFEADFVSSLRCIPMQVRFKLDTCGVKLKLAQWHAFTEVDRARLVQQPCDSAGAIAAYRALLVELIKHRAQADPKFLDIDPNPPWDVPHQIPETVQDQAAASGVHLTLAQWAALTTLQRFALCKLSRPGHENRNFVPALQEFGLMPTS